MHSEKALLDFLIRAKKATYASQGDEASVPSLLEGSRQLEFRSDPYFYRDIYFGMRFFVGQEVVYHREKPIWSMSYSGGVEEESDLDSAKAVYAFLRKAMRQVSADCPFRGPRLFAEGDWVYRDSHQGSLQRFEGEETISFADRVVYRLTYSGGLIR